MALAGRCLLERCDALDSNCTDFDVLSPGCRAPGGAELGLPTAMALCVAHQHVERAVTAATSLHGDECVLLDDHGSLTAVCSVNRRCLVWDWEPPEPYS